MQLLTILKHILPLIISKLNKCTLTRKGIAMIKRERIKKVIGGVRNFLKKEERIIEKPQIQEILPHRNRMLLLDEVIISDKKVIGRFLITGEVCQGHEFNGQLIFRGVDIIEMSAQLLGMWAAQHSEFEGKLAFFKSISGEVKFKGMVVPSDNLSVEIPVDEENPRIEISGRPGRLIQRIIGENFVAKVDKNSKATISRLELIIVDTEKLS